MKRAPIKITLDADKIRGLFNYDPASGKLFHKKKHGAIEGSEAGRIGSHGYRVVKIHQSSYYVHRVIWIMMTGEWPKHYIDHANGLQQDNRWANLREATHSQNMRNSSRQNKNKLKGAYRHGRRWRAIIRIDGRGRIVGNFETEQEAHAAYWSAAQRLYGEFARAT